MKERESQRNIMDVANSLVKGLVMQSANSACCWMFHQPKFPLDAEQLKKIK